MERPESSRLASLGRRQGTFHRHPSWRFPAQRLPPSRPAETAVHHRSRVAGGSPAPLLGHQPKAPFAAGTWTNPEGTSHPSLSRHRNRTCHSRSCSDGRPDQCQSIEPTPQGGTRESSRHAKKRRFSSTERLRLRLRLDILNLTNRSHFAAPDTNPLD